MKIPFILGSMSSHEAAAVMLSAIRNQVTLVKSSAELRISTSMVTKGRRLYEGELKAADEIIKFLNSVEIIESLAPDSSKE